ncbi:hypothetical protein QJQ45_003147 [Haematococcus lacustris]|nr:hypothetical protein QJQ45_003147 [Haematococcus lacustris]
MKAQLGAVVRPPRSTFRCCAASGEAGPRPSDRIQQGVQAVTTQLHTGMSSHINFFRASCLSGLVASPALAEGSGSGGPGGWGGSGSGGSGGNGGGGAGGGAGPHQPLYDLADEQDPTIETVFDSMDSEESEPAKESKWLHLITPTDDIDAVDGRRSGNNRCVEVVIEGWPSVGSLPKQVRLPEGSQQQGQHQWQRPHQEQQQQQQQQQGQHQRQRPHQQQQQQQQQGQHQEQEQQPEHQ